MDVSHILRNLVSYYNYPAIMTINHLKLSSVWMIDIEDLLKSEEGCQVVGTFKYIQFSLQEPQALKKI